MSKDLKYGEAVDIIPDASKKYQKVRAAFVIPSRNVMNMMQFESSTTVYQAEVLAIAEAVRYVNENGLNGETYRNCLDSKSGLEALKNIYTYQSVAGEIIYCQ
jgi:post-segregation antitoxin (ccd killing protein)